MAPRRQRERWRQISFRPNKDQELSYIQLQYPSLPSWLITVMQMPWGPFSLFVYHLPSDLRFNTHFQCLFNSMVVLGMEGREMFCFREVGEWARKVDFVILYFPGICTVEIWRVEIDTQNSRLTPLSLSLCLHPASYFAICYFLCTSPSHTKGKIFSVFVCLSRNYQ